VRVIGKDCREEVGLGIPNLLVGQLKGGASLENGSRVITDTLIAASESILLP